MMNDREFDRVLEAELSAMPLPVSMVEEVNPWRTAVKRIVWGLALTTITFHFLYLDYILPVIGNLLLWMGLRTLRRENGWFTACWCISLLDLVVVFGCLAMNATIWRDDAVELVLSYIGVILTLVQIFAFWRGIKAVRRAAGQEEQAGAAGALVIWYIIMLPMALLQVQGWLFLLPILISYGLILWSLTRVSALLDGVGYQIKAAPVWVSDRPAWVSYVVILSLSIVIVGTFFTSYPMEWTPIDAQEQAGLEDVKEHLLELGFPEYVLEDLTPEDLAELKDAQWVKVEMDAYYLDDGDLNHAAALSTTDLSDEKYRLLNTSVAVLLPDDQWMVIHHFRWLGEPEHYSTEAMEIWPTYVNNEGYEGDGTFTGRLLYDQDGVTYTGDYWLFEWQDYTYTDTFFGNSSRRMGLYAAWSHPRNGENCRGYVAYLAEQVNNDQWLFDSWMNFTYQETMVNYPAVSALEYVHRGTWNGNGVFRTHYDAIQFRPCEELPLELVESE